MKEKLKKVGQWMEAHSFELVYGASIAASVGITLYAIKAAKEIEAGRQRAVADSLNSGSHVLSNPDGSFWVAQPASN